MKETKERKVEKRSPDALIFTNEQLSTLVNIVSRKFMHGEESKARNVFVRLARPHLDDFELERQDLQKKYAVMDDAGMPRVTPDGSKVVMKDQRGMDKAYYQLLKTKVVLDIIPSTAHAFRVIRNIINQAESAFQEAKKPRAGLEADLNDAVVAAIKGLPEKVKKALAQVDVYSRRSNDGFGIYILDESGNPTLNAQLSQREGFTADDQEYLDRLEELKAVLAEI